MSASNHTSDTMFYNQKKVERLKSLREQINWEMEDERRELFNRLHPLIKDWYNELPNLRDVFQPEEIDRLLSDAIENAGGAGQHNSHVERFIMFVARTGYKDEPQQVDENGEPFLRRTTPIHRMARRKPPYWRFQLADLFEIYDRFDVNYADEFGFTHFHAACVSGCRAIVEKFLDLGQDPNCLVRETGDSPLHLALEYKRTEVFQLLMRYHVDPTLANKDGLTPLHIMCKMNVDHAWVKMLFVFRFDEYRPIQIDARDNLDNTPLHLALGYGNKKTIKWLMRKTDLNSANAEGSTPLHIICQRKCFGLAELLFEVSDEKHQPVQIDARDQLGRTPLQWAVANLKTDVIDLLLDRGADLSSFVFPTETYFGKRSELQWNTISLDFKLGLAASALIVAERLVKRGYELDRSDALTIMAFFAEHRMFQKSAGLEKLWCDGKKFASKAKKTMISPSLSLYDLIKLRPEEAAKQLTYADYYDMWNKQKLRGRHRKALAAHLCEKLSRGFFRQWALDCFSELTQYRMPIDCYEMIIEPLINKDLWHICLAAQDLSS